jgi:hypothetical protein
VTAEDRPPVTAEDRPPVTTEDRPGLLPISVFDLESLRGLLLEVLAVSLKRLPGTTDEERKRFCVDFLVTQVETLDDLVPAIAAFLDLPLVDALQRTLIEMFVDRVYDRVVPRSVAAADAESHVSAVVVDNTLSTDNTS